MAIKLILLKSGETVITEAKQLVSTAEKEEDRKVHSYIFNKPHRVQVSQSPFVPMTLMEGESSHDTLEKSEREVQVSLTPWILLSKDDDVHVQLDWVVTIVDPVDSLFQMYMEKVNG